MLFDPGAALPLDGWAAFAGDQGRNPPTMEQFGVGGVDNRIDGLLDKIALDQGKSLAVGKGKGSQYSRHVCIVPPSLEGNKGSDWIPNSMGFSREMLERKRPGIWICQVVTLLRLMEIA